MFCTRCGTELPERANFCFECGLPTKEVAQKDTAFLSKISEYYHDDFVTFKRSAFPLGETPIMATDWSYIWYSSPAVFGYIIVTMHRYVCVSFEGATDKRGRITTGIESSSAVPQLSEPLTSQELEKRHVEEIPLNHITVAQRVDCTIHPGTTLVRFVLETPDRGDMAFGHRFFLSYESAERFEKILLNYGSNVDYYHQIYNFTYDDGVMEIRKHELAPWELEEEDYKNREWYSVSLDGSTYKLFLIPKAFVEEVAREGRSFLNGSLAAMERFITKSSRRMGSLNLR